MVIRHNQIPAGLLFGGKSHTELMKYFFWSVDWASKVGDLFILSYCCLWSCPALKRVGIRAVSFLPLLFSSSSALSFSKAFPFFQFLSDHTWILYISDPFLLPTSFFSLYFFISFPLWIVNSGCHSFFDLMRFVFLWLFTSSCHLPRTHRTKWSSQYSSSLQLNFYAQDVHRDQSACMNDTNT